MKGQIATRNMEDEIRDTFAVFGTKSIDIQLLRLMAQVCNLFLIFEKSIIVVFFYPGVLCRICS
jgi:hypothetical protein